MVSNTQPERFKPEQEDTEQLDLEKFCEATDFALIAVEPYLQIIDDSVNFTDSVMMARISKTNVHSRLDKSLYQTFCSTSVSLHTILLLICHQSSLLLLPSQEDYGVCYLKTSTWTHC